MKKTTLQKIADLAMLNLEEELESSLENILVLTEKMNLIDTTHISPIFHSEDISLALRKDEVTEENFRKTFQDIIAPLVENGLYLVPKVIE